jgi:hypothetical protein
VLRTLLIVASAVVVMFALVVLIVAAFPHKRILACRRIHTSRQIISAITLLYKPLLTQRLCRLHSLLVAGLTLSIIILLGL